MDDFIQELVETLEDYDEPVVLVMYGDHLPTMGLTAEDVENRYPVSDGIRQVGTKY